MDLNELYKEIEKAEIDLNAKRLKYIKEALVENGGSIKLKFKEFKEFKETNDAFDFDDQFPVIIEIAGIPMYLTEVYVKKNDFRIVLLDYDDMTLGDYDNTGENEQVAYFINYCLNQDKKEGDWKEDCAKIIDNEVKSIGMWMWGDVKGYVLEKKVAFTKKYKDESREDEDCEEWEEVDSCWGCYEETNELIKEVMIENDLEE